MIGEFHTYIEDFKKKYKLSNMEMCGILGLCITDISEEEKKKSFLKEKEAVIKSMLERFYYAGVLGLSYGENINWRHPMYEKELKAKEIVTLSTMENFIVYFNPNRLLHISEEEEKKRISEFNEAIEVILYLKDKDISVKELSLK